MRRCRVGVVALVWALTAGACTSDTQSQTPTTDSGGGWGDPDDPVICVGDPETGVVCKKESEFWDCTAMPNGDVKCGFNEPVKPDGTHEWTCVEEEGHIKCTTPTPDVPGGAGWTCTSDANGTTCVKDAIVPPGGGTYDCTFDGEFNWTCTGTPPAPAPDAGVPPPPPVSAGDEICYDVPEGTTVPAPPPEGMWAKLVAKKVLYNGVPAAYVRLTLSKAYVDNTYGAWAIGWGSPTTIGQHHSFGDLLESDKNEFFVSDPKGNLIMHMAVDYMSQSSSFPSGYGSLGVTGGEGQMIVGDPAAMLGAQTSLSVNFNAYNYVLPQDSPETDLSYTPNPTYPKWIFEAWYELWIDWAAFGSTGPGKIYITGLHASPNKTGIKGGLQLVPVPCPP